MMTKLNDESIKQCVIDILHCLAEKADDIKQPKRNVHICIMDILKD